MKLPVNKTTAERSLIREGWKNKLYVYRGKVNENFPRGVWFSPGGRGPYSLAVACLLSLMPEPDGQPFAELSSLADVQRQERREIFAARLAEREAIKADRAAATAARAAERALW